MLNLFPQARYILSTQPVVNPIAGDFNDIYDYPVGSPERKTAIEKRSADLETYLTQYENEICGQGTAHPANTYIFDNGALQCFNLFLNVDQATGDRHSGAVHYEVGLFGGDGHQIDLPRICSTFGTLNSPVISFGSNASRIAARARDSSVLVRICVNSGAINSSNRRFTSLVAIMKLIRFMFP